MTIGKILIRNIVFMVTIVSAIITAHLFINYLQKNVLRHKTIADKIIQDASQLMCLTAGMHYPDTAQVYGTLESLCTSIVQRNGLNQEIFTPITENLLILESNFDSLLLTNQVLQMVIPESEEKEHQMRKEHLTSQIHASLQSIIRNSNIVSEDTVPYLEKTSRLSSWLMIFLLAVISLLSLNMLKRINICVTHPLERLLHEVGEFEKSGISKGSNIAKAANSLRSSREISLLEQAIHSVLKSMNNNMKELQKQNTFIQTILDNIPLGIAVNKYKEGTATYINHQFEKIYGWPKEHLADVSDFFKRVYPDKTYREQIREKIMEDIKSGNQERMRWEKIEITTQTGQKRMINAQNIPLIEQNLMISTVEDITEMVHIRKDRDRIFENSMDMICTATLDGYLVTLNPAWEKVLGWSVKELKAQRFIEFIHPKDLESTIAATKDLAMGKPALNFENRYRTKQGRYKWLSWNTIPILSENLMLGIARDISEKKLNEIRLRQSEEKFSTIFKNSPNAILLTRLEDGEIIDVNTTTVNLLGYAYEELIGKKTTRMNLWETPENRRTYIDNLRAAGRVTGYEDNFITKKGELRTFRISGEIISISDATYILNILDDITEIKKVQDRLKESQKQLQSITNNIPGVIIQYKVFPDGKDTLEFVSEGSENIWGISREQAMSDMQQVWTRIAAEDVPLVKNSISISYKNMSPWNVEFRNVLPDGSVKWTQGIGIPRKMSDGSVVWDSLLLDITDRKMAEEKLRNYQDALKNLTTELSVTEERQRKKIAENIHDHLSQSLVISKMKINDLLKENALQPHVEVMEFIRKHISEALENSRNITYELSPPILYEMGLVETMYWLTEKIEEEYPIKTEFSTDFETLKLPEAAAILIFRCIQEIIFNVIKHAEASILSVLFISRDEGLRIIIRDNGKGFNVSQVTGRRRKKGFGLFTVQERIQNLSGSISIDSAPGNGTSVTLFIPLISKPSTNDN